MVLYFFVLEDKYETLGIGTWNVYSNLLPNFSVFRVFAGWKVSPYKPSVFVPPPLQLFITFSSIRRPIPEKQLPGGRPDLWRDALICRYSKFFEVNNGLCEDGEKIEEGVGLLFFPPILSRLPLLVFK
jgi:hypothetical protein